MKILKLLCLALLLLCTGCAAFSPTPPDEAIRLAIATQLTHTQQTLAQDLGIVTNAVNGAASTKTQPNFKIEGLRVKTREKITDFSVNNPNVNDLYRVDGTFMARLKETNYPPTESPFEVYLGTRTAERDTTTGANTLQTWYLMPAPPMPVP